MSDLVSEHRHTHMCVYIHVFMCLFICIYTYVCLLLSQSCPTLCDPMDCSPPGSSVLEILQARKLEWVAILFSMISPQSRHQTWVFCIAGRFFTMYSICIYMEFAKVVMITLYARQQKRHRCIEQSFGLCGRGQGWDDLKE